ncbi:MAG: hypothetical protein WAT12_02045 [Candidatus Nitrotoga sp.]
MTNCTNSFYTAQLSWRPYVTAQSSLWPVGLLFFNCLFIHILRQHQRVCHIEAFLGQRVSLGKDDGLQFPGTFKRTAFATRDCPSAI